MRASDVADVLEVSSILQHGETASDTIAALIEWRDSTAGVVATVVPETATKRKSKAKTAEPEPDSFEASPDPSADEPDF